MGLIQGRPGLGTGVVPAASSLGDLQPLAAQRDRPQNPTAWLTPVHSRELCVFAPEQSRSHWCVSVDDRVHDGLLHEWICSAFQLPSQLWRSQRILSPLPDMPSEQYLLLGVHLHLTEALVPVDLRPLGGTVTILQVARTIAAGDLMRLALRRQSRRLELEPLWMCRQTWFAPSAQVLLVPGCDALQAWHPDLTALPTGRVPACARTDDLQPPAFDVMAYEALLLCDFDGAQGCYFVEPSQPLPVEIASVNGASVSWYNIDNPLPGLPASQFVLVPADAVLAGVVDCRARGAGYQLQYDPPRGATDNTGNYHPCHLMMPDDRPAFCQRVSPTAPEPPAMLEDGPTDADSSSSRPTVRVIVMLALSGMLVLRGTVSSSTLALLGFVCVAQAVRVPDDGDFRASVYRFAAEDGLLGIREHHLLAQQLALHSVERAPLTLTAPANATGAPQLVSFHVWSPQDAVRFILPVAQVRTSLGQQLRLLDAGGDRRQPVLINPQFAWPCVQFVVTCADRAKVTVLVDVGTQIHVLDVLRHGFAADLLQQLSGVMNTAGVQFDRGFVASARHGDVLRAYTGPSTLDIEVGHLSVDLRPSNGGRWLAEHGTAYVVGPDFGVLQLHLTDPTNVGHIMQILVQKLGVSRCQGLRLARMTTWQAQFPLYCLPRMGSICHTFVVEDAQARWSRPVVQAVDSGDTFDEAVRQLIDDSCPSSPFWKLALGMLPAVQQGRGQVPRGSMSHVYHHHVLVDLTRVSFFGWPVTQHGYPQSIPASLGVPRAGSRDASAASVGTQTWPEFWPLQAEAIHSSSLPAPIEVRGCSPVLSLCPDGPMYALACRRFDVTCLVPCLPGYHLWGLRLGAQVFSACTSDITWQHVLTLAKATSWDLPGLTIVGEGRVWEWPQDLADFSGQCGHLLDYGRDPYLCTEPRMPANRPPNITPFEAEVNAGPRLHRFHALLYFGWPWLLSAARPWWVAVAFAASFATHTGTGVRMSDSDSSNSTSELTVLRDSTRTCTVAWCHELACQTTHFGVTFEALADYLQGCSPSPLVRVACGLRSAALLLLRSAAMTRPRASPQAVPLGDI